MALFNCTLCLISFHSDHSQHSFFPCFSCNCMRAMEHMAAHISQAWRRRWFKLVIQLQEDTINCGPVVLEYYSGPRATRPKGIIDLDCITRISPLLAANHDKRLRNLNTVGPCGSINACLISWPIFIAVFIVAQSFFVQSSSV